MGRPGVVGRQSRSFLWTARAGVKRRAGVVGEGSRKKGSLGVAEGGSRSRSIPWMVGAEGVRRLLLLLLLSCEPAP